MPLGFFLDGAAYDPEHNTWRRISDAPIDIPPGSSSAFAAGRLFVKVTSADEDALISYDVSTDSWKRWDAPEMGGVALVADGNRILFVVGSHEFGIVADLALDIETELPGLSRQRRGGSF